MKVRRKETGHRRAGENEKNREISNATEIKIERVNNWEV